MEQKQQELVYLIFFLVRTGHKRPTIKQAQAALREAIGLWSLTTADIALLWPL